MATSAIAGGKLRTAALAGKPVPPGLVLDAAGNPSTDPHAYLDGGTVFPLGGDHAAHKGFGLAIVVDALAGVLTGAGFALSAGVSLDKAGEGKLFLAIDPASFLPRDEFLRRLNDQIDQIKAAERRPGVDEILVPGERGLRRRRELQSQGAVPLMPATWRSLEQTARSLGVPLPPAS